MASVAAAATPSYDVVFSYQGAFGPPTYGHYKSMEAFAQKLNTDFPDEKILMLFMPTAGGSKSHLLPTRIMRKKVLDMFCNMLTANLPILYLRQVKLRMKSLMLKKQKLKLQLYTQLTS